MKLDEYKKRVNEASDKFKALWHTTRLCTVCKLMLGELNVSQMQACLDVTQSNV